MGVNGQVMAERSTAKEQELLSKEKPNLTVRLYLRNCDLMQPIRIKKDTVKRSL